jgi:hypothetical protein
MHHAFMENLFLNAHGARNVTLVSPRWSQFLQPSGGRGYSGAANVHGVGTPLICIASSCFTFDISRSIALLPFTTRRPCCSSHATTHDVNSIT